MRITLQLLGLFGGVFSRTWIPYIRKLRQGKIKCFDKKYIRFALSSIILSLISVLLIIPQYKEPDYEVIDLWTGLKVFCTAFAFGFGWNSIVNETAKWKEK